jgi:hypothetical protein
MKLQPDTRGLFTRNEIFARQYACRAALRASFPQYDVLGYQALQRGQPVFYYTDATLRESFPPLGLPTSSFIFVKNEGDLDARVTADLQRSAVPVMLLTTVGAGATEALAALCAVAKKHKLFTHVEGCVSSF